MSDPPTRVALGTGWSVFLVGCGVVGGAVLGFVLVPVTDWLSAQPWIPWRGLVRALERFADWAEVWIRVPVGIVVGALVGLWLVEQTVTVEVSDRDVVVVKEGKRRRWSRAQVGEALLEGRRFSLRDHEDADLVAEKIDGEPEELRAALVRHGWPIRT